MTVKKLREGSKPEPCVPMSRAKPARRWFRSGVIASLMLTVGAVMVYRITGAREGFPESLSTGAATGFDVVVVTMDTTRADHIGCYGYADALTPTLDQWASEGVRFDAAVSPAPMTLPSHSTLFTGLEPYHHGVRNNGEFRLDSRFDTLAVRLSRAGYQTGAFVSAFVLDARFGLARGFDHYDDAVTPARDAAFGLHNERSAEAVTEAALGWLAQRDPARPVFLWVHYFDPHHPYAPPAPYAARFAANLYDGEIAYMDAQLGRLRQYFAAPSRRNRTLIIAAGDHGEGLGEHLEGTHTRLIYDATQHVPLIIWCPGAAPRAHVVADAAVGLVDITPTVLDVLGLPPLAGIDGESLRAAARKPECAVYMETMATYLENGWAPLHGLRTVKDKFILAPKPEYYDLQRDPKELNNLFGTTAPRARTAISEMMADLGKRLEGTPSAEAIAAAAMELDAESRRRLQALGYVGGAPPEGDHRQLDPKDMMPIWNQYLKVHDLVEERNYAAAIELGKKALAVSPRDRGLLQQLGKAYALSDQPAEAETVLRRYLEIRGDQNVLLLLAQVLIRVGRLEEASVLLDQASALEPEHGGVLIARGDIKALQGETAGARALYEEARRRDPYRAAGASQARIRKIQPGGPP